MVVVPMPQPKPAPPQHRVREVEVERAPKKIGRASCRERVFVCVCYALVMMVAQPSTYEEAGLRTFLSPSSRWWVPGMAVVPKCSEEADRPKVASVVVVPMPQPKPAPPQLRAREVEVERPPRSNARGGTL